jgi:hypothetical protein
VTNMWMKKVSIQSDIFSKTEIRSKRLPIGNLKVLGIDKVGREAQNVNVRLVLDRQDRAGNGLRASAQTPSGARTMGWTYSRSRGTACRTGMG